MLTEEFITHFRNLLAPDIESMTHDLAVKFNKLTAEYNQRGHLLSGAAMVGIASAAAETLPARIRIAMLQFERCRQVYKIALNEEVRREAESLLLGILESEANSLRDQVIKTAPFRSGGAGRGVGGVATDSAMREIARVKDIERRKLSNELLLMQKKEESQTQDSSIVTNHMTFNAPVANVMTGTYAVGHAIQNIGPDDAALLKRQIDQVIEALKAAGVDHDFVQMADEAKEELNAAKPNAHKIKSLLSGIGDGIKLMPGVKACYDVLKPIAASFGIFLP